ncbi:MAG: choice-of-anchor tandem repeat GloVer-containing protein [Steroidobacteraceae bacterium]
MKHTLRQRTWIVHAGSRALPVSAALLLSAVIAAPAATAQTFTLLHSFAGGSTDGYQPKAGLVQATNGDLYGTTTAGGTDDNGVVFKITAKGKLTAVLSFEYSTNGTDGSQPYAGLIQNGELYGTTDAGGTSAEGTVFKVTPAGKLTTLHSFVKNTDGANPRAGLIRGANGGDYYGTTYLGGNNGVGTAFKITPGGTLTVLHSFNGSSDGGDPVGPLVLAANGDFYGTTYWGGASGAGTGTGTVFKLTPGGKLTTLFSFCAQGSSGCTYGANPAAGLLWATDGDLYGITNSGGLYGYGTIFKITTAGTLTTLHSFDSTDGANPVAGLIQATDGNFYGTTSGGGAGGEGTVFMMTPDWTLTTLYSFCSQTNCADGGVPNAGLLQATDGDFYGTTYENSAGSGGGTVFKLSMGLSPFVEPQLTSGAVGASIKILGTDLTGATGVTFNGIAAAFTVASKSEIKATVPTGATTGAIVVTTPGSTLNSNGVFTVKP